METERIALSQEERDRLQVLRELEQGGLKQIAAAQRMKVTDRQVRRLLLRWRKEGDRAVIHGLWGRPSNRKFAVCFQRKVLARVGQRYADFGPTLAAESELDSTGDSTISARSMSSWRGNSPGLGAKPTIS